MYPELSLYSVLGLNQNLEISFYIKIFSLIGYYKV